MIQNGRDFSLRDASIDNFFVSCRFIGTGDLLTSQICWDIQKPNFNFRHSSPILLNDSFLVDCCQSNVLIFEVWSFCQPVNKLVGIATISLHQIFVAYQVIIIEKYVPHNNWKISLNCLKKNRCEQRNHVKLTVSFDLLFDFIHVTYENYKIKNKLWFWSDITRYFFKVATIENISNLYHNHFYIWFTVLQILLLSWTIV